MVRWTEITRVPEPGGSYFAEHVGPTSVPDVFLGPQPESRAVRDPQAEAPAAGPETMRARPERLRAEFTDIAAVVYFLRKVI
ncbi:hypothetical protein [Nocardia aurantiaca]|uniref:Uncharacterized protein n=1 Tax=Nocardia aurantiaca TaxID=2675850 RepID=A0A6I3LBF8_9NOCA|nr:hypothetical protein [Nocardia aurantiaca]MTE17209.1 hypothetical protein [Nocardia aurantiaca]